MEGDRALNRRGFLSAGLIGLTGFGFTRVPAGFIPSQDKGRLIVNVQLPDSAALERTATVMANAAAARTHSIQALPERINASWMT